jgi:leucyl/phenylalanyl-tRNA--protein transferase
MKHTTAGSARSQLFWVADQMIAEDFPPVASALKDPNGLLAIGGDLSPERLLSAYRRGIFPWFSAGQPILWWSPNPRCVLEPDKIRISHSLRKTLRQERYRITFNQAFREVIAGCARTEHAETETWITPEVIASYTHLHELGQALSVESWDAEGLAGGLYGVVIGRVFFGESMFSRRADASKVALARLGEALHRGGFRLLDCQVHSRHLQSLGAMPMPRESFVNILRHYCELEPEAGWREAIST